MKRSSEHCIFGVLVANYLWPQVYSVKKEKDQVWFSLSCVPNHIFGACYIPPSDSPYFQLNVFATIHEKCINEEKVFIMGDLNARIPNLERFNSQNGYYTRNPDTRSNQHGQIIFDLCKELNVQPINHFNNNNLHCDGGMTFRQRKIWISQLDWTLCSTESISLIKSFEVIRDENLPTNHAVHDSSSVTTIMNSDPSSVTKFCHKVLKQIYDY